MNMTWREWLTATEFWKGAVTWEERLWNATRWRCYADAGRSEWIPHRFKFAYRSRIMDRDVYALMPFHLVVRAWHWCVMHRWCIEQWGIKVGLFQTDIEGGYYKNLIWRWPVGRRRSPADWSREKQLKYHPALWADDPPKE